MNKRGTRLSRGVLLALLVVASVPAHEETRPTTGMALAQAAPLSQKPAPSAADSCRLQLHLVDARSRQAVGGLIRVKPIAGQGDPLEMAGLFSRPAGWYSLPASAELRVPPGRYKVEATRGTDTAVETQVVTCTPDTRPVVVMPLIRIYDAAARHLYNGNTHLHLLLHSARKVGVDLHDRQAADDYLRTVGASDGLDLVYVSYLTAPGAEIISNEYTDDDFLRFSQGTTRYTNGVELRHGGARRNVAPAREDMVESRNKIYPLDSSVVSFTYGHVLLLDLEERSMPASIGPGLSLDPQATDGVPLRTGIIDARRQGGCIVWCHGTTGLEEIPDWVAGLIDAQNIYDGGNEGTFDTVYYPYLNAGLKIPFSTGTDWGITDFSRVFVEAAGEFTSKVFLQQLTAGRSYITNEPFLEFQAGGKNIGDTISMEGPGLVHVRGRAVGRSDFIRLQVIRNGQIVGEATSRRVDGHFEAAVDFELPVDDSGWLALRIPPVQPYEYRSKYSGPGINILGKAIFAHTSPVYLTIAGRPQCDPAAVAALLGRLEEALHQLEKHGTFANDAEKEGIRRIYREAKDALVARPTKSGR